MISAPFYCCGPEKEGGGREGEREQVGEGKEKEGREIEREETERSGGGGNPNHIFPTGRATNFVHRVQASLPRKTLP